MQQSTLQYLAEQLALQEVGVYLTRPESFTSSFFRKKKEARWVEAVYAALGGTGSCWNIRFELPEGLETEEVRLTLDGPLQFNRYRAISLQSPLYEVYAPSWLESYRRHCHSAERECLKAGSRQGIWSNTEAGKHFGQAQEPGDFFGKGAPGWRLQAFRDFLADCFLLTGSQKHVRVALYDRLMIQGKLQPLQQLLLSRSELNLPYLLRFLGRQLGVVPTSPSRE